MKHLRYFKESFDKFDYQHIIRILRKTHGWGMGIMNYFEEFESSEYFKNPEDDNDYAEQYHIFLTDQETGQLRGRFNNKNKFMLGKWKLGRSIDSPVSIYNKLI